MFIKGPPSPVPAFPSLSPLPHAITQLYLLVAESWTWLSDWACTHAFFSGDSEHLYSLSVQPSSCVSFSLHSVWTPFTTFSNFKPQVRHPVPLVANSLVEFLQPRMSWARPGLTMDRLLWDKPHMPQEPWPPRMSYAIMLPVSFPGVVLNFVRVGIVPAFTPTILDTSHGASNRGG